MKNKDLKIYLAAPRGFCAGVDRAIEIVKKSINKFGSPVYVRHEIVHNKHVVENLRKISEVINIKEVIIVNGNDLRRNNPKPLFILFLLSSLLSDIICLIECKKQK